MKKYILLVKGIEDLTGGPRYVNNKCRYLKDNGWDVLIFWSYDVSPAQLEYLLPYDKKEFIIHELQFYPCWFSKHKQKTIINTIAKRIGFADQIVIESNKLQLGAWGEMLAEKLNAKHISFIITEKTTIHNSKTFDFCYAKLQRKELFTINSSAVKQLFSKFVEIDHPEEYYWSASVSVDVEEYDFPDFDELPNADYTITSFGRTKGYFNYMLKELNSFITDNPNKKFNLFFLGDLSNVDDIEKSLKLNNAHIVMHPEAVKVIPRQVFTKSDVVIATAGCAIIAAENGCKVISMDVNRKIPLGLLNYTTLDSNTFSGVNENDLSLSEWLNAILINHKVYKKIEIINEKHSFDYQMQYVTVPDGHYIDTSRVREKITKNDKLWILLSKIGLFKLVNFLYFLKRKN